MWIRALAVCALLSSTWGCSSIRVPAIDPSGQRIFLPQPAATTLAPHAYPGPRPAFTAPARIPDCPPALGVPQMGPAASPSVVPPAATTTPPVGTAVLGQDRLILSPARIVAPVDTEVILLAGICGPDGYYVIKQPVEWLLSQNSVGTFVDVSQSRSGVYRMVRSGPGKFSNNFAITRTSTAAELITRGTADPRDDVWLQKGQTWISVTSSSEGVSYVTAVATGAENWDRRRQAARIHWVDAQWVLPAPAVVRAGQSHLLTTTVSRSSSGQPAEGWTVRYEVAEGLPAVLSQQGATVIEQQTDAAGKATVQIFPQSSQAGSTRVQITIFSPTAGDAGTPIAVGEGSTTVSWSAPGLTLEATGPHTAALDATATYRILVTNNGDLPSQNVTVTAFVPQALTFLNSSPAAERFGDRVRWSLGTLAVGASQQLELNCRAARPGDLRLRVEAGADGLSAESIVATRIVAPALEVRIVDGPETARVGERVHFNVEIANVGAGRLENVVVRDTFDSGLEHTYGEASPIERTVGSLEAGQVSQFGVSFFARQAGRLCHTLQVTADGGHSATARACVEVAELPANLRVTITGPAQARVGERIEYRVEITNTGQAPLTDLQIVAATPASLSPQLVSPGYSNTAAGLLWQIAELLPGKIAARRIQCDCLTVDPRAENVVTVTSAEGAEGSDRALTAIAAAAAAPPSRTPDAGAGPATTPQGPVTGVLQLTVRGNRVVQVGQTAEFVIELVNDRDESDRNLTVRFELPVGLEFRRFVSESAELALNPRADGSYEVELIREIRPRGTRTFRVEVVARQTGEQTFRAQVLSLRTPTPVEALERIRVNPN